MKRIGLFLSLMLLLLLAACGGAGVEQLPTSDVTNDFEEPAEPAGNAGESAVDSANDDASTVAESDPTQVRERDWAKGAEDPLITVIEYGDFQ